jgi:hypothetical protein
LKKEKFTVNRLVLNYDSKVIGLEVAKMRANGIIMTAASPLDPHFTEIDMDLVMMDDVSIWSSYEDTLQFLTFVSKETKARIPCLPRVNVVDDGRLIGIMTETNQFMEIQPHIPVLEIPPVPAGVSAGNRNVRAGSQFHAHHDQQNQEHGAKETVGRHPARAQ